MIYFNTRAAARQFAQKTHKKVVDCGCNANRRWAVKVLSAAN
jgi:hypothetical protein